MRIVHIQSENTPAVRKKSKKDLIREAAVESLSIQRAIDKAKAKEKFAAEQSKLETLTEELNNLIADNNLQHYQLKNS